MNSCKNTGTYYVNKLTSVLGLKFHCYIHTRIFTNITRRL